MVQSKRGASRANSGAVKPSPKGKVYDRAPGKSAEQSEPFGLQDYININLIFAGFCVIQLVIVRMLLRDFAGLYFFFGFLVCAFLVASIFDYFSEKLHMGVSAGDITDLPND